MTTDGAADWIDWGYGGVPGIDHKMNGGSQISNYSIVGVGPVTADSNVPFNMTWTDGSPTLSVSVVNSAVRIFGTGNGFRITAPATPTIRTFKLYCGGIDSSATCRAHVSDQDPSQDPISNIPLTSGSYDQIITISPYSSFTQGQTLTVTYTMTGGTGSIHLRAATLTGGGAVAPSGPSAPASLTATPGNTQVSLAWPASSGATSYIVYNSTTSGGPYTQVATPTATSYVNTGLSNGTAYYFVVTAVNANGEGPATSQASATPVGATPGIPSSLTATPGNAQVLLSWTASSGATSYNVKRSTISGSGYATVSSPATTSYTNTGLTNGTTYYYVVSALSSGGESGNSGQASATPQLSAPAAPTGLTATPGNTQAIVSWTASSGATAYNVKRSIITGGPYTTVGSPSTTSFTNTGLTNGTTYYYVVSALNAGGESANSAQVSAALPPPAPPAPTGLAATPGNAQVTLSWTASSGATSYNVLRSTVSGSGYANAATGVVSTGYTNTGLTNGTTYYFVVQAVNSAGTSANGNQVSATPAAGTGTAFVTNQVLGTIRNDFAGWVGFQFTVGAAPLTVTGVGRWVLAGNTGAHTVKLVTASTGVDVAGGSATVYTSGAASGAYTYGSLGAGVTLAANTSYYLLTQEAPGGDSWYDQNTAIATTSAGGVNNSEYYDSAYHAASGGAVAYGPVNFTYTIAGSPPPAPTGLTATAGNTQVALSWTASTGATAYNVKRSTTSGGPYTTVSSPSTASFSNTGLTNGTTYYFVVSALNSSGESGNSSQAGATPQPAIPAAPTGLTATPSSTQVALSWTASSGATSYNVLRSTVSGSGYASVTSGVASTSYTNTGLTNGTAYYFVVQAVNAGGTSGNSNEANATPSSPNTAPTVATPAAANPNPVTGTTTSLSVLGADDGGEAALTYTWATTGTPPASVSFSANGTNAAKNSTVTFTKSGSYTLQVTITDGASLTATSAVTVAVNQTLTGITVSPPSATVGLSGTQQYAAQAVDQFGGALSPQPAFTWTVSGGGAISTNGLFTAGSSAGGPFTVTASSGGVSGTASVTVTSGDAPPTVATAAHATPNPVTSTSTALAVLGADDGGEAALTYTWATTTKPASVAAPTFSANGTNAAKNTTVTFKGIGSYTFTVTIKEPSGLTTTSSVNVTVNQTVSFISVTPASASIGQGATQQFTASAKDLFGVTMTPQPTFTWTATGGTVSTSGLFTAGSTNGSFQVTAAASGKTAHATVTISGAAQVLTTITVSPPSASITTGGTQQYTATGKDQNGNPMSPQPVFTWSVTGGGTINSSGLFTAGGAAGGPFTVTASSGGVSGTASVTVTAQALVLTTITVSPPSASITTGATQQYTATGLDQNGNPMSPQPVFTWSVTGGGTINSSGLFTAGGAAGGPFTVTATSGGVSGTASVTVTSAGNQPPTVATPAAASPSPVISTTAAFSVLGADDGGEAALTYTWGATTVPSGAASPTFSANGTNAAKNTTVTFKKAGNYTFTVTIKDASNLTCTSTVNVTVNQTISFISVTPTPVTIAHGATQQFTASAKDLFGVAMSPQPTFTWTATGGTVTSGGLYTAGSTTGTSFNVTAAASGKSGKATVTIN